MLGKFRDALRHRDLRVLVDAFVIDGLGSWAYLTVLLVYIFDRTHSTTWIALANLCRWGPALVLAPYAGVIADRFQRTTVMITSALLSCAAMVGLAMVVIFTGPVALLLVLAGIAACVAAPYRPAAGALTPDVVGEKDLAAANGLLSAVEGLVVVIGPGVGALLLLTGAPVSAFLLNAASFLIAAGLVSRARVRSKGGAGERGEGLLSQLGGRLREPGAPAGRRGPGGLLRAGTPRCTAPPRCSTSRSASSSAPAATASATCSPGRRWAACSPPVWPPSSAGPPGSDR